MANNPKVTAVRVNIGALLRPEWKAHVLKLGVILPSFRPSNSRGSHHGPVSAAGDSPFFKELKSIYVSVVAQAKKAV